MNKKLLILSVISLSSILLNAIIAYLIFSLSVSNEFVPSAFLYQDYNSSKDTISYTDYDYKNMSETQQQYLTSKLIIQYIVDRYTFIPDQNYFDSKMGVWYKKKSKNRTSSSPQFTIGLANTYDAYKGKSNIVWDMFADEKNRENYKGASSLLFTDMLKDNVSQQVEIISEPIREKNYWTTRIKLHKKELGKPEITETLKVYIEAELKGIFVFGEEALLNRPELYFYFLISDFKEE